VIDDDELPSPPQGLQANTGRYRRAASEWAAVEGVRARLGGAERLRGPLEVRQTARNTWIVQGGQGPVATVSTHGDALLIAHAAADMIILIRRLLDTALGDTHHRPIT